jgi:hypothetical protein
MSLPSIDENWWDGDPLPEPVTADEPTCPHCGLVHEMPKWVEEYHRFDCDCGWRFHAEKKQVIVSSPVEFRQ